MQKFGLNKINKPYNALYFDKFQITSRRKDAIFSKKLLRSDTALGKNTEILFVSKQYVTILCNYFNL